MFPWRPYLLDLLRRGVDRARQLRVRLGGLRANDDVRLVLGELQRDLLADAARRARDHDRLAGEFAKEST